MAGPHRLLAGKNLSPKKYLGQNFLADPSTAEMIVRRADVSDAVILEIGSGLGALTLPAAAEARHLYAVEKDRDLVDLLAAVLSDHQIENVELINKNIFDVNIRAIADAENERLTVMGNLPYNISSQVVVSIILNRDVIDRAILMLQREMAVRLYAEPGSKAYGRLSVMTQYCAAVRRIARIAAHQFYPRPKVDSEVVEIHFRDPTTRAADEKLLSAVVKAAFGQRRKTLRNALIGSALGVDSAIVGQLLAESGIDGSRRAETLQISEFVDLSNRLANLLT